METQPRFVLTKVLTSARHQSPRLSPQGLRSPVGVQRRRSLEGSVVERGRLGSFCVSWGPGRLGAGSRSPSLSEETERVLGSGCSLICQLLWDRKDCSVPCQVPRACAGGGGAQGARQQSVLFPPRP